jgi:hypothetical protein
MRFQDEENEDDFDEKGLLRDGHTYRIPHHMQDSLSRAIADHIEHNKKVADAFALNKPGYRFLGGRGVGDALLAKGAMIDRQEAYDAYEHSINNAWRDWGARPGDVCMTNSKRPGHLNDNLECVADNSDDAMDSLKDTAKDAANAYQDYARDMGDAWKNPRPTGARYLEGKSGDYEIDDRCAAIRQASLQRGHDRDEIESYLSGLDDDAVLDADVDEHVKAFDRQRDGTCERGPRQQSSDVATLMRDHQQRMANLYAERKRESQEEWRCGK